MKITKRGVLDFFTIRKRNADSSFYEIGGFWRGLICLPFSPIILSVFLVKCIGEIFLFLWWIVGGVLLETLVCLIVCTHSTFKNGEVYMYDLPCYGNLWDDYRENSILFRRKS